jgi:hypothetical protein
LLYCFPNLPQHFNKNNIKARKLLIDGSYWRFKKDSYILLQIPWQSQILLSTLPLHMSENLWLLFHRDFSMDSYGVDSDEAMKLGDEHFIASIFLECVKHFIASSIYCFIDLLLHRYDLFSEFNASSALLFKKDHRSMPHHPYFQE